MFFMENKKLARILQEIADYLKMEGADFKPYAYQRAALVLDSLEEDVREIYRQGGKKTLEEIPGVGKSIAEKIEEFLKTGKIQYHESFKKRLPLNIEEIIAVEGVGPRKAKALYQKLGIRGLKDLEEAAKTHKIAPLFGFGEKTENNILESIAFLKRSEGRFLLGEIFPKVEKVYQKLSKFKEVEKISLAGSVRRMKETIGDVDFLVISRKPEKVMDFFVSLPGIIKIWGKGKTKASVRVEDGFDMDIRVVSAKSYGAALQYLTGSKEHNIAVRTIAIGKGLKLSEYGLFSAKDARLPDGQGPASGGWGSKMIASKTEEEIYRILGMQTPPPEIRENEGEIEAALKGELPGLLNVKDIKGDLHCHSDWDGGANSIEEMAKAAKDLGYEYIGISDHTKFLRIERGLNEKQLLEQRKEIDKINRKLKIENCKFKLLHGCEANIMPDGSIDISDEALARLDYVIAGVHSSLKMEKEKMTKRIVRAMENPNVDIISHPTGRLIKKRDAYQMDFDEILRVASKTGTILEINSSPTRLDLNDQNIRRAKEAGVKMIVNTDSHHKDQLQYIGFGVAQARRGWAEKEDVVNTQSAEKLLRCFK